MNTRTLCTLAAVAALAGLVVGLIFSTLVYGASRTLTAQIRGSGPNSAAGCPPGPLGDHWVHLQNNGYVDSYDSRVGAWEDQGQEKLVVAGCNCNGLNPGISLDNNAVIYGNAAVVTPESDGDIIEQNNAVIWDNDEKEPPDPLKYGSPRWLLNPIPLPSWWTLAGDSKIGGTYGSKNGCYAIDSNDFRAYNNATVTFSSGEYHFRNFELSNNSKVVINAAAGPVTIFITGSVILENNSEMLPSISFAGDTTKLRFLIDGTDTVDLSNNVSFYGLIYAPHALIEIRNNDNIFGNLVGKEVYIWNNAGLHYDRALGSVDFGGLFGAPIPPPENMDWREIIKVQ